MTQATQEQTTMQIDPNNMTLEQQIAILKSVHTFFSTFDRVPGLLASDWGNNLNALALVANSLIKSSTESN